MTSRPLDKFFNATVFIVSVVSLCELNVGAALIKKKNDCWKCTRSELKLDSENVGQAAYIRDQKPLQWQIIELICLLI